MYGSIYRLYSFNSHFVDRQLFFRIYFNVALTRNSTYSNVNSWFSTANTPAVALSISAGACCFRRTVLSTWSLWLLSSHTPTSNPPAYPPAKAALSTLKAHPKWMLSSHRWCGLAARPHACALVPCVCICSNGLLSARWPEGSSRPQSDHSNPLVKLLQRLLFPHRGTPHP